MVKLDSACAARIVVADDEEGLLFLMSDALRREGHEVHSFENGGAVLDWLTHESADLLVLDLKLGDLPASALVDRLRGLNRNFPFIIVTGHGDERTAVEVMKQGALDYIMKDAGMLELLPTVVRRTLAVAERDSKLAKANAALKRSEQRNQRIIQTALDGFIRFQKEGKILEVNDALCALLGYSPEEVLGWDFFEMQASSYRDEAKERVSNLGSECADRCISNLMRKDGTSIEVELSIRRDGDEVFAFVHDMSEHRRLEREVLKSVLDERSRFGRELHDGLGQQLTALEMMAHGLARGLATTEPKKAAVVKEMGASIQRAVKQTRQLAHGLAPLGVEAEGLMVALAELARETASTGVQCAFECPKPVSIPDSTVASHLYRIAQEGVTNALKHARATRIIIELRDIDGRSQLSLGDDGRGFPRKRRAGVGVGLELLHHRARLIGAQLSIDSQPGKGVRIVCSVPKQT